MTAPEHNATVASPVTFTWQPCSDGNVTSICLDLENQDADDDLFMLLSPDDSEAGVVGIRREQQRKEWSPPPGGGAKS